MKGLQDENKMLKRKLAQSHWDDPAEESLRVGNESQYYTIDDDGDDNNEEHENDNENAFHDFPYNPTEEALTPHPHLHLHPRSSNPSHFNTSLNRNLLANHPPARVREDDIDLDLGFETLPLPPPPKGFQSDWNLPNQNPKRRKVEQNSDNTNAKLNDTKPGKFTRKGGSFALSLDKKGHVKGTVQLAPRTRLGKRG